MFVFAKIDYHRMLDLVPWFYGVFMLLLVATKLFGHKALGGRRWIKIGPMLFQPSEWVKLILILAVARYFANLGGRSLTWRDIFKALALGANAVMLGRTARWGLGAFGTLGAERLIEIMQQELVQVAAAAPP